MASTTRGLSQSYLNETNVPSLLTTCIVFLILNTLFVGLRFLSRHYQTACFGWDDFLIALGWVTTIGLCIDGIGMSSPHQSVDDWRRLHDSVAPRFGVGLHFERVMATMPEEIPNWGRNGFYAVTIIYSLAVVLPKMSVLILYLRVFKDRFSKYCCWAIFLILAASAIINVFIVGFQCNNPAASWDPTIPGGHCNNIQAHLTYASLPNIITDVAMLVLPIPVVRRLQVALHVKIGLAMTFLVASM